MSPMMQSVPFLLEASGRARILRSVRSDAALTSLPARYYMWLTGSFDLLQIVSFS